MVNDFVEVRGKYHRAWHKFLLCSVVIIVLLAGFDLFSPQSYAATVTVCDTGCNYNTIASALAAVGNGNHTITVQSPYSSAAPVTINNSGTDSSSRLLIQGKIGDTVTVNSFNVTSDYITIRNFRLNSNSNDCIEIAAGRSNISIENNLFYCSTAKSSPLRLYQGAPMNSNVSISNNKFYNIGYVLFIGGNNITFENNLIEGNLSSTGYTPDAMWTYGNNVIIRGNEIKNLKDDGVNHVDFIQSSGSAQPDTGSTNILIENNFWHDGDAQLCNLSNNTNSPNYGGWIWRNNIFKNIRYRCNVGLPNVKIYNNIFENVDFDPAHGKGGVFNGWLGLGGTKCDNIDIRNNISVGRWLYLYPIGTDCPGAIADYNMITSLLYGPVAEQPEIHGINGGDPKFVDRVNNNYNLQIGSPAINKGTAITSFSWDKLGVARPQGSSWDMGPFEKIGVFVGSPVPSVPSQIMIK